MVISNIRRSGRWILAGGGSLALMLLGSPVFAAQGGNGFAPPVTNPFADLQSQAPSVIASGQAAASQIAPTYNALLNQAASSQAHNYGALALQDQSSALNKLMGPMPTPTLPAPAPINGDSNPLASTPNLPSGSALSGQLSSTFGATPALPNITLPSLGSMQQQLATAVPPSALPNVTVPSGSALASDLSHQFGAQGALPSLSLAWPSTLSVPKHLLPVSITGLPSGAAAQSSLGSTFGSAWTQLINSKAGQLLASTKAPSYGSLAGGTQVSMPTPILHLSGATSSAPQTPQQLASAYNIPIDAQLAGASGLGSASNLITPFSTNLNGLVPKVAPVTQYKLPQQVECLTGAYANVSGGGATGGFLGHGGATICSNGTITNLSNIHVVPFGGDIAAVQGLLHKATPAPRTTNPFLTGRIGRP